jgi:hypothetical protein
MLVIEQVKKKNAILYNSIIIIFIISKSWEKKWRNTN